MRWKSQIHSIEINDKKFNRASKRFAKRKRIHIHHGSSPDVLSEILDSFKTPTLFWLDAHFNSTDPLPLRDELATITNGRDVSGDVFLIDDLKMFITDEDEEFEAKEPFRGERPGGGVQFLSEILLNHKVLFSRAQNGIAIALPKDLENPLKFIKKPNLLFEPDAPSDS